jgi:hypothetical protein
MLPMRHSLRNWGQLVSSRWQIDRGQLNHNWLQNGVLVGLHHALNISSGMVRSQNARGSLLEDVQRWQERRNELPAFLGRFENEMSPKVLFDRIPLCRCSVETRKWLIPLTHELWLRREKVQEKIALVKEAYKVAERTYERVHADLQKIPLTPTIEELWLFERLLREFTAACEDLSLAISALPHEIRVV